MAQLGSFSGVTSLSDVIPSAYINDAIASFPWPPSIAEQIAWIETVAKGYGGAYTFPRWDEIVVPAGTKLETDEFTAVEATTSAQTASVSYVGLRVALSREAEHDSKPDVRMGIVAQSVLALRNRIDADLLGLAVHADVEHDFDDYSGQALTEQGLLEVIAAYRDLNPGDGEHALIVGSQGMRDLQSTVLSTTAPAGGRLDSGVFGSIGMGYVGSALGVRVFHSRNVITDEGDECAVMTPIGDERSGLGLALAEPVGAEVDYEPARKTSWLITSARYGVVITDPSKLLVVRSRASA